MTDFLNKVHIHFFFSIVKVDTCPFQNILKLEKHGKEEAESYLECLISKPAIL